MHGDEKYVLGSLSEAAWRWELQSIEAEKGRAILQDFLYFFIFCVHSRIMIVITE